MAKIRFNFTFPYRWLKEDRQFLKKNLERQLPRFANQNPAHSVLIEDRPQVVAYSVRLKQHAYQPQTYKMDVKEMSELLADTFPGASCRYFEKFFVQKSEPGGLPVMEIEIYF